MTKDELSAKLAGRTREAIAMPGFAESAVLVPLVIEPGAPLEAARLVFTVRRDDLRTHAGQISFPGGRRDPGDGDLDTTALREAEEEIGIARTRCAVLGRLDDVPTPTRFVITPVVGLVEGPVSHVPHAAEVAQVFECSVAQLRDPAIYRDDGTRRWQGVTYVMHEYHVDGRRIWGATARIVHQLLGCLG